MQTVTINILNPKVEKIINTLVELELISVEKCDAQSNWYEDEQLLAQLNEEQTKYEKGELKTFTLEEVNDLVRMKKKVK